MVLEGWVWMVSTLEKKKIEKPDMQEMRNFFNDKELQALWKRLQEKREKSGRTHFARKSFVEQSKSCNGSVLRGMVTCHTM